MLTPSVPKTQSRFGIGAASASAPQLACCLGVRVSLSGQLTVPDNCRVTGRFTQRFNGGSSATCRIPQATVSKDKEVVTGVGKCNTGAILAFDMVKR
jgi:hypothetical protein